MRALFTSLAVLALVSVASANIIEMPLDAQINIGRTTGQSPAGDAMYDPFSDPPDTIEFPGDEPEGYMRHHMDGGGRGSWWYQYVDFYLAGETDSHVDLSGAPTLEFDLRIYENPVSNGNPYGDVAVFVRLYTYDDDGTGTYPNYAGHRDFGIVNQVNIQGQPELQYPNWQHIVVDLSTGTDGGTFDVSRVSRMRFYGTNWAGDDTGEPGHDWRDFKNLVITPEPASLALLALGGIALIRRR